MDSNVINQLPAAHCLTGCDTVAKVGTKKSLLKALNTNNPLISDFGKESLDGDMILHAEQFLIKVLSSKKDESCKSFDELRVRIYHRSSDKKFIDLPCTSNALHENIRRSYMQVKLWLDAPFLNAAENIDPQEYGYVCHLNANLMEPKLFHGLARPVNVPDPCKCTNCTKRTCSCRVSEISCSAFCGCAGNDCKNPINDN